MLLFPLLVLFLQGVNSQDVDQYSVSLQDKLESLERNFLLPSGLGDQVDPCGVSPDGGASSGEQTSAEWTRVSLIMKSDITESRLTLISR
jgi:hypothetical protein